MTSSLIRRLLAAALAGALLVTVVSLTPAQAHVTSSFTHLWKHIKKKADARYLKKSKAPISARTAGDQSNVSTPVVGDITPMQTSITAPSRGFLVIQARGVYFTDPTPLLHCGVSLNGSFWAGNFIASSNAATDLSTTTCLVTTRLPVAAGTHSVAYVVHNDGSGTATFSGGDLNVTFVAYGSTGALGQRQSVKVPSRDINKR